MSIEYWSFIYQDLRALSPNDNRKFWILLVKIFSLKPRNKSNTSSYYRRNQILFLQENSLTFLQTINFVKIISRLGSKKETCKTKAIQADLGIFTHILTYSDIIRHIQELFRHIQIYSESCVTRYIKKPHKFKTRDIFRTLSKIYDEALCEFWYGLKFR